MSHHRLIVILAALAALSCQTSATSPATSELTGDAAEKGRHGYFVAVAADGAARSFYRGLYELVDRENRRLAAAAGSLPAYAGAFAADGYTRLGDAESEIECDREKCLLKLTARTLVSTAPTSLAALLTQALGGVPLASDGLRIGCAIPSKKAAGFRCSFDLERGRATSAALDTAMASGQTKGRLVNCALAPGVVRSADEAMTEVEGGGLLKLAAGVGDGAHPVGFLRYARQGGQIEFLDLYLCGDMSHDYFRIEGPARAPKAWLAGTLEGVVQDDARLSGTSRVVATSQGQVTVEVRFRLNGPDTDGAGCFYVRLDRDWVE